MSKRENKRFNDPERRTAPKRGGKNRRDYGDSYSYEPRRRGADADSGSSRAARPASRGKAQGGKAGAGMSAAKSSRSGSRRPVRQAVSKSDSLDKARRGLAPDISEGARNIGMDGLEVVAGRNPVMEVLNGERTVERVFIAVGTEGSVHKIAAVARDQGVIVEYVPKEKIDAMAPGVKHQGVAAKGSEYKYAELEEVFGAAAARGEDPFIVVLDEITDPHNLGAVIRTAECAGAHGVIIPKRRACALTQTVALSAAGAVERVPVVQVNNLARTIEELQARGLWVAAADMDGVTYYEHDLTGPIAIVIGNEGKGVGKLVKEKCDFVLSIPMKGEINSLNASNAAAVLMYGILRARLSK